MDFDIKQLITDEAVIGRARQFTDPAKWKNPAKKGRSFCGIVRTDIGNFQVSVVLGQSFLYHCSCPDVQKPCKHIAGLLQVVKSNTLLFLETEVLPVWAISDDTDIGPIQANSEKPLIALSKETASENASYKNNKKLQEMSSGMEDLKAFLSDIIRLGLGQFLGVAHQELWQHTARRLEDAKMRSLAYMFREMGILALAGEVELLTMKIGELNLIYEAFQKYDKLPESNRQNLLYTLGANTSKTDIMMNPPMTDLWQVIGIRSGVDMDKLHYRRVWIFAKQSAKWVLLQDYVFGFNSQFPDYYKTGVVYTGRVYPYPHAVPQRVLSEGLEEKERVTDFSFFVPDIESHLNRYRTELKKNPFIKWYPIAVKDLRPAYVGQTLILSDKHDKSFPVDASEKDRDIIFAAGFDGLVHIFGEWTGITCKPLSLWDEKGILYVFD